MKTVTIVIADDHPMVRRAVIDAFRKNEHIQFQGEADNGIELMQLVEKAVPDIAIIDLEMPKMNGYDVILELHTKYPQIKAVVFTGFLDPMSQQRAFDMGAFATISKSETARSFVSALEDVIDGKKLPFRCVSQLHLQTFEK